MTGTLLSCQIGSIRSLKDGSVSILIETPELSPGKVGELFALRNQLAAVYISPKAISQKEIDQVNEIDPEFTGKTSSQRLRNSLFVWFSQEPQGFKDFDSFYKSKMELFIDNVKANLS